MGDASIMPATDFIDRVLDEFQPVRAWFGAFAKRLEREVTGLEPDAFETSLHNLQSALRTQVGQDDLPAKLPAILGACRRVLAQDDLRSEGVRRVVATFNVQAGATSRSKVGGALTIHLEHAWKRDPLALAIISSPISPFRPSSNHVASMFDWYRALADALAAWEPYRRARSPERRSVYLREYAQAVCEGVYKGFVYKLAVLGAYLAQEPQPKPTASLGVLVKIARRHFPALVDPDASRIRNAAAHRHWRYQPLTKTVVLHNQTETWRKELPVTELGRRVKKMADTAARGMAVVCAYGY